MAEDGDARQEPIESDPTIGSWPADAKPPRKRPRFTSG
jgi:hypothetical protein